MKLTHLAASLIGHIYVAEILLYEIGLQEDTSLATSPSFRIALLSKCLQSTKDFLTMRFSQEIRDYPRFICMSSFDFVYTFLTALKLITHRMPGWDVAVARRDLEFDRFIERQVTDMECMAERRKRRRHFRFDHWAGDTVPEVMEATGPMDSGNQNGAQEDPFLRLAKKIRELSKVMVSAFQVLLFAATYSSKLGSQHVCR
jgi:hypothetical protein